MLKICYIFKELTEVNSPEDISMRKQSVNQEFENNSMEVALGALGKSIARWTDKGDRHMTAVPPNNELTGRADSLSG